jgi:poly-gamma-glutamate synthesis protein (capsule biosynthesis protein)
MAALTSNKLRFQPSKNLLSAILFFLTFVILLTACQSTTPPTFQHSVENSSPTPVTTFTPETGSIITPTSTVSVQEPPYSVWIDPSLPDQLKAAFLESDSFSLSPNKETASIKFTTDNGEPAGNWFYIAAVPFYSSATDIELDDLKSCWNSGNFQSDQFSHIIVTEDTRSFISLTWGPADDSCVILPDQPLTKQLWLDTTGVAILPFEFATPDLKILSIGGNDPLAPDFNSSKYPLKIPVRVQAPSRLITELHSSFPITNFNPQHLSSLALTGVTAMVRDTAAIMEEKGLTYPAGDIQNILLEADITHINNEVPFAEDCPPPESSQTSLRFCSNDSYFELLKAVGTDIVELSGDHFGDWGPSAMLHTLELYDQAGIQVYGGGRTLSAGLAPLFIDQNSNQFAFIGCNAKAVDRYATASASNPGAAGCDFEWMISKIRELSKQGYLVIATMQHEEIDSFYPIALQQYDFRRLAEAGAVIVSGSQAHHPQGIEFSGSSLIHYGLGNLFFDQWYLANYNPEIHINKDKAFIDMHYFYNGKHISTRLIPLQFIDNARPRLMTPEEAEEFLTQVFQASTWNGKWINLYSGNYYSEGSY